MGFEFVRLSKFGVGVCASRIEVVQQDVPNIVRRFEILEHATDTEF
jgi:hypothetical protein